MPTIKPPRAMILQNIRIRPTGLIKAQMKIEAVGSDISVYVFSSLKIFDFMGKYSFLELFHSNSCFR